VSLVRRVEEAFSPGGLLARAWPRYEERPAQRAMAIDVARTLEHGGVLLAEAPTGVGKSLAYLLPAVLMAHQTGRRVVVATCTRSLQDQLFERDLPALLGVLGISPPCALLKGKQNYVCPRSLDLAEGRGAEENQVLDALRAWAASDTTGDLDRFAGEDAEAFRRVRPRVATDRDACTLLTCRRGRECFWVRARRQAAEARLVVVNHALLALSGETQGLLPEFDVLVVDEAHRLEGVLLSQLERSVSRQRFEELLRVLGSARGGRREGGLLGRLRRFALPLASPEAPAAIERLAQRVPAARADADALFDRLAPRGRGEGPYGLRERYHSAGELLGADLAPLEVTLEHCAQISRMLHRLAEGLEREGGPAAADLAAETEQVGAAWTALGADLEHLADAADRDWVYWRSSGGRGLELHGAPVSVGAHARRLVLGRAEAAVLTSATLSADGDFSFLAGRLGLGESWGLPYEPAAYPSPFPLARQMRVLAWDGAGEESEAVARVVAELARLAPRNILVLFTAHERLRRARERLLALLPDGVVLLAQEWDGAAGLLSERFRRRRGAVLLGVQSLWEGVDFPGEALEIVVVSKLPFSVPDDPLVESRAERLREQGLDPFRADAVPEAVLRFRQGVGRLIRRADDRGVLVVCDPRLVTAGYRGPFLAALPVAPSRIGDPRLLAGEADRFLRGAVAVEEEA
jgi:DNA polymerase-3 subunit epsilon/ATP-dependent DNA helicase DinG